MNASISSIQMLNIHIHCYMHSAYRCSSGRICIVWASWIAPRSYFLSHNKDFLIMIIWLYVFVYRPWWSLLLNKTNFGTLSALFPSQWKSTTVFTAECTIMTLCCLHFQNKRILPNRIFWFSAQNTSSCMLTVSQTTKTPIYSGVPLNHRAVCSLSIFLLTVSIVLIMHGACVHRALLLIFLRWICSFGLLWRCRACVWITASSVSQSPAPTCTSPLMNSPAAHYWRHFTVV